MFSFFLRGMGALLNMLFWSLSVSLRLMILVLAVILIGVGLLRPPQVRSGTD